MSSSTARWVIEHDFRLDILCCLIEGEPLTIPQISLKLGKPIAAVAYHVKLLEFHELIKERGGSENEALCTTTLDHHPDWVMKVIEEHTQDDER